MEYRRQSLRQKRRPSAQTTSSLLDTPRPVPGPLHQEHTTHVGWSLEQIAITREDLLKDHSRWNGCDVIQLTPF
jgi:phytoene dehydrogenase-like protein